MSVVLFTLLLMWISDAYHYAHHPDNAVLMPPARYLAAEAARREFLGYGPGPWLYETVAL